jgi:hypothetical protein
MALGVAAVNKLKGKPMVGEPLLNTILGRVRRLKGLSVLEPFVKEGYWAVRGDVQRAAKKTQVKTSNNRVEAALKKTQVKTSNNRVEAALNDVWDAVVADIKKQYGSKKKIVLSASAANFNYKVLFELIVKSPANEERRNSVLPLIHQRMQAAQGIGTERMDSHKAYQLIVQASGIAKGLYPKAVRPKTSVHHQERVAENTVTFTETRARRLKKQILREIKGLNLNTSNVSALRKLVRGIAYQKLELIIAEEIKNNPKVLAEVNMIILTDRAHYRVVHPAEAAEKRRQRTESQRTDVYQPNFQFED